VSYVCQACGVNESRRRVAQSFCASCARLPARERTKRREARALAAALPPLAQLEARAGRRLTVWEIAEQVNPHARAR
jgi:hypothetical protein